MEAIIATLSVIFVIWIVLMLEETFTRTSKRERDLKRHIDILKHDNEALLKRQELDALYSLDSTEPDLVDLKPTSTKPVGMWISAAEKAAYLNSPEWHALKSKRLVLANHQCECGKCDPTEIEPLDLHHGVYDRLGCEHIDDVRILKRSCHQRQHNHYGYDRTTIYLPLV